MDQDLGGQLLHYREVTDADKYLDFSMKDLTLYNNMYMRVFFLNTKYLQENTLHKQNKNNNTKLQKKFPIILYITKENHCF